MGFNLGEIDRATIGTYTATWDTIWRQVHGVRHVNALAPDQRLTLHRVGLTIIYGDNGSGKSGYACILKKVCCARMPSRVEEIISNIYDIAPGMPTIEYAISGQNRTCAWQLGQAADTALSAVSVFDSRTANIHVDETNDLAYTSVPLKLLGALAQLCKSVKDKLVAEVTQIKAQTPQSINSPTCNSTTTVGRLIAQLATKNGPCHRREAGNAHPIRTRPIGPGHGRPCGRSDPRGASAHHVEGQGRGTHCATRWAVRFDQRRCHHQSASACRSK